MSLPEAVQDALKSSDAKWWWSAGRILSGRTFNDTLAVPPVPLPLVHPAFASFVHRLSEDPSPKSYRAAQEIIAAAPSVDDDEITCNKRLIDLLKPLFQGMTFVKQSYGNRNRSTDGTIVAPCGKDVPVLNLEMKMGGDPAVQNDSYILQMQKEAHLRRLVHNAGIMSAGMPAALATHEPHLPCFQLDVHQGTVLVVRATAVPNPSLISESLVAAPLYGQLHGPAHHALARVLHALHQSVVELCDRYLHVCTDLDLKKVVPTETAKVHQLVRGVRFNDGVVVEPTGAVPSPDQRRHVLVFEAKWTSNVEDTPSRWHTAEVLHGAGVHSSAGAASDACPPVRLLVKFVNGRYGIDAHAAAAAAGHAPALYRVGAMAGGWTVVIMGKLEEDPSRPWRQYDAHAESPDVVDAVLQAYEVSFTNDGFVHGDLRPTNVFVRASADARADADGATTAAVVVPSTTRAATHVSTSVEVAFIDFDWAGKEGEALYPLSINPSGGWRTGHMFPAGKRILRSHDRALLTQGVDI